MNKLLQLLRFYLESFFELFNKKNYKIIIDVLKRLKINDKKERINYLTSFYTLLLSIGIAYCYTHFRAGFQSHNLYIFKAISFLINLIFLPNIIFSLKKFRPKRITNIDISIIYFFICFLIGFLSNFLEISIAEIFFACNLFLSIILIIYIILNLKIKFILKGIVCIFVGFVLYHQFIGINFHSPISLERLPYTGWFIDHLYFSTMQSMMQTHGILTLGLDGIQLHEYQYGSIVFLAYFNYLMNINPIISYNIIFPIIIFPFFVYIIINFILFLNQYQSSNNMKYLSFNIPLYIILLISINLIGYYPLEYWEKINLLPFRILTSESYMIVFILSIYFFYKMLIFQIDTKKENKIEDRSILKRIIGYNDYVFLIILLIIISVTKLAFFLIINIILFYLIIRIKNRRFVNLFFFLIAFLLQFIFIRKIMFYRTGESIGNIETFLELFTPFKTFVKDGYIPVFLFTISLWIILYIFYHRKQLVNRNLYQQIKQKKIIDLEIMVGYFIFTIIIYTINLFKVGGEIDYFASFNRWLGLILFSSFIISKSDYKVKLLTKINKIRYVIIIFILITFVFFSIQNIIKTLAHNYQTHNDIIYLMLTKLKGIDTIKEEKVLKYRNIASKTISENIKIIIEERKKNDTI